MGRLVDRLVAGFAVKTFESVAEYVAAQPDAVRPALKRVRAAIRKALPKATETISYGMPTYKIGNKRVIYLAAWKNHISLYGATSGVVATFKNELAPYKLEKGTIRFPLSEPMPVALIERIARFRAGELEQRPTR